MLNATLTKQLQAYTLQVGNLKRSWHKGTRKSTRFGASHDFSDYRMYEQGDDLRQIDWNIYARTQKHYIKRYLDEQELTAAIYLDCTKSMTISNEKWKLAKTLTAAFGYLTLSNDDRVSIIGVHGQEPPYLYRKGKAHLYRMMQYVGDLSSKDLNLLFSEAIGEYLQRKSSVSIVITDLMEPLDTVIHSLKLIQANKQNVYLLQVLDEDEFSPSFEGDFMLVDSETNQEVNVTVSDYARKSYLEKMKRRIEILENFCFERGISYISCHTGEKVEDILFNRMTTKGWIR
ncbi:DUF58 domain-containing protein [Sutcliffiella rhizosphaerae]|uniref:DUF58 domain-containing protein n=1 Tax=Sutcliffiella rhizosphaerae TaxID=2880967 RepID=A0ABM8YPP1_9BACI|nr:DUF58 domain-containing protein [Sutcliffiella rhizosphaerae]CAG9621988.1 hypothetical protein BACCIP111883_02779 [Sutcliffiella rhizosphaerae]